MGNPTSTTTSTRPDAVEQILAGFCALRHSFTRADEIALAIVGGDRGAYEIGAGWLRDVNDFDRRLLDATGGSFDDALKLYEMCGLKRLSDAVALVDGDLEPEFSGFEESEIAVPILVGAANRGIETNDGLIKMLEDAAAERELGETEQRYLREMRADRDELAETVARLTGRGDA
jgi:hypothetical protein